MSTKDWIGYRWLAREFKIEPTTPFQVSSRIGPRRTTVLENGFRTETYLAARRPTAKFSEHLGFALKHEGVHLEFLARLFHSIPGTLVSEWVNREPFGQYARRAGFFYEWLTGKEVDFPGVQVGNYCFALPPDQYLAGTELNVPRWRIRNNLPGTPAYCPTIRLTDKVRALEAYDIAARLKELEHEFGADILMRSAVWLTIKESRASFQIEHEESQKDRIKRFASVMEHRIGTATDPLEVGFLTQLQCEILGERALRSGPRQSPVFVGETAFAGEIVHYVAPHWDQIEPMLDGLRAFDRATRDRSSLARAAALSFGFVFIHPMADGNGRISRFLVNDVLRRDGALPKPYVLPISSTITRSVANRVAYDDALEVYSKPLVAQYAAACSFGELIECADGVKTNFAFSAYDQARPAWAYPDLTPQVEYLGDVVRETIEVEMRQEAKWLLELRATRERVKGVMEAPDVEVDRIIRSIRETGMKISGNLIKEFPVLADQALAVALIDAVRGDE